MCGGCPGGSLISPLSAHVTLRGIKAQVTRELARRCAPRFRVVVFGNSWVVSGATGKQTVCTSIEDAAFAVLEGVRVAGVPAVVARAFTHVNAPSVDLDILGMPGCDPRRPTDSAAATIFTIPRSSLRPKSSGVPSFPAPETLTPWELVDCLLWFATSHPAAIRE